MSYLLLFLGSYRLPKYLNYLFVLALFVYSLFGYTDQTGVPFILINSALLIGIPMLISLTKGKLNKILGIFGIYFYSVIIDVIDFFLYPEWTYGATLPEYIWNGLTYNFKGLIIASVTCLILELVFYVTTEKDNKKDESKVTCN